MALTLTTDERRELERRVRSRKMRAEDSRRARVILMLADGESFTTITTAVGCYPDYVSRWKQRFETERLAGLRAQYRGQPPTVRTPALEARVLAKTRQKPPDGSTHWTTRKLAKALGISHMLVARVWRRAGLQPHRFERYMLSDDPDFEQKAADIIGLYLNPPQHAAVFAVDEKTAIQALDRLDPVLPLSPGRAERHGFEYYRHGTLSLYAALNTQTGEIIGQTVPRHTSEAFVDFLGDVRGDATARREISRDRRQPLGAQDQARAGVSGRASPGPFAFHADLRVVAQSSGALVWQNRTRPARARHLHLAARSRAQDSTLHHALQRRPEADSLDLFEPGASHYY